MSALAYLALAHAGQGLKRALRRPSFWIVTVLVLAILGVSFFGGGEMRAENLAGEGLRDVRELVAMAFALNAVMFVMLAMQGLSRGASMFSMAGCEFALSRARAAGAHFAVRPFARAEHGADVGFVFAVSVFLGQWAIWRRRGADFCCSCCAMA